MYEMFLNVVSRGQTCNLSVTLEVVVVVIAVVVDELRILSPVPSSVESRST